MKCPKCSARIGVYQRRLSVSMGEVRGMSCYVCGFWRNEFVPPVIMGRNGGTPATMRSEGLAA